MSEVTFAELESTEHLKDNRPPSLKERMAEHPEDYDFSDIPDPEPVGDQATLEDMIGEGYEVRTRGKTYIAVPPSMTEMSRILRMLKVLETAEGEAAIGIQVRIAQRLFWVKADDQLRPATATELETSFSITRFMVEITKAMSANGVTLEGNA